MNFVESRPFLRIPPFPGASPANLVGESVASDRLRVSQAEEWLDEVRRLRVGGDYWAKQPELPVQPYTVVTLNKSDEVFEQIDGSQYILHWSDSPTDSQVDSSKYRRISGSCDPWHVLMGAEKLVVHADDELALIASIIGIPVTCLGAGRFSALTSGRAVDTVNAFCEAVGAANYSNPFSGEPMGIGEAIQLSGFWRNLIDSNRDISAAFGFAFWKQPTVAPLLWGGHGNVSFNSNVVDARPTGAVAVWKSRTPAKVVNALDHRAAKVIEVEDGFIRSSGLGSDCVPPLSIAVDRLGVHFDPGQPSELEELLQNGDFAPEIVERARELRELIVVSDVSKYGVGSSSIQRRDSTRAHMLVPGQVEDDRAVLCGGGPVKGNLDLLMRAREQNPGAYIIYKPHPDVEAGHRVGAVADADCLEYADEVVRDQPISSLIDLCDELQVNSSLAGFEALLRAKPVTTHGVPFYAGWGLTRDLGPVPERRTAKRSLDELVAAVLLLYPRYLDPVTGLPCPPEVLVRRIAEGAAVRQNEGVVQLRRLHGRWKKRLSGLIQ